MIHETQRTLFLETGYKLADAIQTPKALTEVGPETDAVLDISGYAGEFATAKAFELTPHPIVR